MSRVEQIKAAFANFRTGLEQAIPDEGTRTEMIAALAELERAATDWPMRLAEALDTIEPAPGGAVSSISVDRLLGSFLCGVGTLCEFGDTPAEAVDRALAKWRGQ